MQELVGEGLWPVRLDGDKLRLLSLKSMTLSLSKVWEEPDFPAQTLTLCILI